MILSVIIPSYNVERFLDKTLSSFVFDNMAGKIEIITVNDGSTDKTAEIADSYAEKYPQVFRTISKENGGHGSTINRGIEAARGKYFKVVDGDDWVNTDDLAKLVNLLETCEADFVVTNYCQVNDSTGEAHPVTYRQYYENAVVNLFRDIADRVLIEMHALTIKTEILQKNQIRLDEHCFYVDTEYTLFPVPFVQTMVFFDLNIYMYRVAQQAQSVSIAGLQKHIDDHIKVSLNLAEFAAKYEHSNSAEPAKVKYITDRAATMAADQSMIFQTFPHSDKTVLHRFKEYDRDLKKINEKVYLRSSEVSPTLRILRLFHFRFYKAILWFKKKVYRKS